MHCIMLFLRFLISLVVLDDEIAYCLIVLL